MYDIATNKFGMMNKYDGVSTYYEPNLGTERLAYIDPKGGTQDERS